MTQSRKKKTTAVLALALAVVVAVGSTLAYLAALTDEYDNAFSFDENVKAKLDEPNWDPEDAEKIVPDYVINKDPMITNVSDNGVDEYVAIRVNFTDGAKQPLSDDDSDDNYVGRLLALLDITWNETDWELADDAMEDCAEQIWVYKHALAPGEISNPLFSSIMIRSSIVGMTDEEWAEEYAWLTSIIMDHTESCYTYADPSDAGYTHDDGECTITYKHHENCVLFSADCDATEDEIKETPGGEEAGTDKKKTCNCTPARQHSGAKCPDRVGTLIADCGHTSDGINGFHIIVKGAVVQAGIDGMDKWATDAATIKANLVSLFAQNEYEPPVITP